MSQGQLPGLMTLVRTSDWGFVQIERIERGRWRVKETETHYIEILLMLFNFRIVTTPKDNPESWDRGWCYFGLTSETFLITVLAAAAWDGSDDTEPSGFDKRVGHDR